MEYNYQGRTLPHLPVCLDFKDGKLYPNDRPGLGVEVDFKQLEQIAEWTRAGLRNAANSTTGRTGRSPTGEKGRERGTEGTMECSGRRSVNDGHGDLVDREGRAVSQHQHVEELHRGPHPTIGFAFDHGDG